MAQAKLLSMTSVLTLLIWASADRLVNEDATVGLVIHPIPAEAEAGMVVALAPGQKATFRLRVSGPRRAVDTLQARESLTFRLSVPESPTGERVLPLEPAALRTELAQRWSEFSRLQVIAVSPPQIALTIDHFVTLNALVEARTLTLTYDSEPQIQRASTTVRLRESVLATLPDRDALQIDIGPDVERRLRQKPFGATATVTVPLDARRFGDGATITPPALDVSATVRSRRRVEQIPTVPVLVALSFANLETRFRALGRDGNPVSLVTRTITVTGPPEAVSRLARGETKAYGIIRIKEDDLRDQNRLKLFSPEYHLPPQVELVGEPDEVELQFSPLDAATNGSN